MKDDFKELRNIKAPREGKIQTQILEYLRKTYPKSCVWKIHEDPDFGMIGLPDIFFAYKGKAVFFEVKRPGEKQSPMQEYVFKTLKENDIYCEVVYGLLDVKRILLKELNFDIKEMK